MPIDQERRERVRRALAEAGLDALVCRLPEHVVLLAGCWPVIGRTLVLFPAAGDPILIAPRAERDWIDPALEDVRAFECWRLTDPPPEESLERLLRGAIEERGLAGKRIGIDAGVGFEDQAPSHRLTEPTGPAAPTAAIYALALRGAEMVDGTTLLYELRARKTAQEVERLRVVNEIAGFGIEAFHRAARPGVSEAAVAAAVEAAIMERGTGHKETKAAHGQAQVFSGPRTVEGWFYPVTSRRVIQEGELVMLELGTVADGYWSDLTRTVVAGGRPTRQQAHLFEAQQAAHWAAFAAMRAGAIAADVDEVARQALTEHNLAEHFLHHTGHGIGFRYHEPIPFIHPSSMHVLASGMVTSLEPGLYSADFGGLRYEDNVLITNGEPEILSPFPRSLSTEG